MRTTNKSQEKMEKRNEITHRIIFWVALSALLILRFPILTWTTYFTPSTITWTEPGYQIGTYLLFAFLIWWEQDNLHIHHLDFVSLLVIIIFPPLKSILLILINPENFLTFPKLISLPFFIVSLLLIILVFKKKIDLKKNIRKTILWFVVGGIIGVSLFVFQGIILIKFFNYPFPLDPGTISLIYPLYQIGFAAVPEEPLFRGFLWGGLRKAGLKDIWILIIQSTLFTLGHIHLLKLDQPLLLFGLMFFNAVIMGILVWRTRTLASSMGFHGFANGSHFIQYWVYSFIFK